MKKFFVMCFLAMVMGVFFVTPAMAFHDGGVAHCDGCHTMHNSEGGQSIIQGGTVGMAGDFLMKGTDPSSTCLNCHKGNGSYHIFSTTTGSANLTPGGDFIWLTKNWSYSAHGHDYTINGGNLGHSIVASDLGLFADPDIITAPGGNFPAANLACSSCHDPHGKVTSRAGVVVGSGSYGGADPGNGEILGNFRLLGDTGYNPGNGSVTFTNPAPIAATTSTGTVEADNAHTDYGSGMSEWCSNCHPAFINTTVGTHAHPAGNGDNLDGTISGNYNQYVATGNLTGTSGTSYLSLVPFEQGTLDRTILDPTTTQGPDSSDNVMCLTCHRAHASAFKNSGRWNFGDTLLAENPYLSSNELLDAYYGRDIATVFGEQQRSLCNKCHIKD